MRNVMVKNIKWYRMNLLTGLFILIGLFCLKEAKAQDNEKIVVPLSQPGKPGKLELKLVNGTIKVTGYNGKEVIVNITLNSQKNEPDTEARKEMQGMKRITNRSMELTIEENDNMVRVHNHAINRTVKIELMVPSNFSLNLETVNKGDLIVENVNGEIEASNVNGSVFLKDISGSAIVNTVNGKIDVSFKEIEKNKPMAFTTLNGGISVSLPASAKASLKMQSEMGEIYSDFDFAPDNSNKVEKSQDGKSTRYKVEKWITGNINGGGPEFLLKNMHGDIYIKKRK